MATNVRIKDLPACERPRERLIALGPETLKTTDLIAILLRTGIKGVSALEAAEQLLVRHGHSLDRLARMSIDDIGAVPGIGRDKAVTLRAAFELARRMAAELQPEAPLLDSAERVANLLREEVRFHELERFHVLLLNTRRRLIRKEDLAHGTLDTILVHARDVFRAAILANAAAVILVHNHPSGDPTPSEADIKVTRDLIRAGQLLKIDVVDHIILGRPSQERERDFVSLRELGYFYS